MAKRPVEPAKHTPKGGSKQVGSSLSYWTSSTIYGFMGHPEFQRLVEYERAMTTDETVGTGVEFIKLAILASIGPYVHTNPKIQDFVHEAFDRMKGNHKSSIGELTISGLWSGFGVSEVVYKPGDGKIWIDFIANYNPKTLFLQVNDKGQLTENETSVFNSAYRTGIWQDRIGGAPVQLPLKRCVVVTHNKRYNNYYGESAIKRIYKNWRLKEAVLEEWNIALDRYGTPVTYAIVPNGYTGKQVDDASDPSGKRPETIADSTASAIAQIHTGTGLVIERPSPTDPVELGTLTTGNNFGDSFIQAIEYYNAAIYRGLLIPALLIQEQKGGLGGGAIATIHFEVFKLMLQQLHDEIVEPFVEQVIGPLIKLNFGNVEDYGHFEMAPFDPASMLLMAEVFEKLNTVGIIDNTDVEDVQTMRIKCGLPALSGKRAQRLADKNHAALIRPEHMGQEMVKTETVNTTKAPPAPPAAKPSGGGGSSGSKTTTPKGPGKPGGTTVVTSQQVQAVQKPVPTPPKPFAPEKPVQAKPTVAKPVAPKPVAPKPKAGFFGKKS